MFETPNNAKNNTKKRSSTCSLQLRKPGHSTESTIEWGCLKTPSLHTTPSFFLITLSAEILFRIYIDGIDYTNKSGETRESDTTKCSSATGFFGVMIALVVLLVVESWILPKKEIFTVGNQRLETGTEFRIRILRRNSREDQRRLQSRRRVRVKRGCGRKMLAGEGSNISMKDPTHRGKGSNLQRRKIRTEIPSTNNVIRLPSSTSTATSIDKTQVITNEKSLLGVGISPAQHIEGLLPCDIRKRASTIRLDLSSERSCSAETPRISGYHNTNDTMSDMSASASATPSSSASSSSEATVIPLQQDSRQRRDPLQLTRLTSTVTFPGPRQTGAPYFDGTNVTKFLITWETWTTDWEEDLKIKKVPLYCEELIGDYVRNLLSYEGEEWDTFKEELLEHFKDSDEEQRTYTLGYLCDLAEELKNKGDGASPAEKRAFIFEFSKKSDKLMEEGVLSECLRILLFLGGLSDKVGNRVCKEVGADVEKTSTLKGKWSDIKKEALNLCVAEDTQMKKLRRIMKSPGIVKRLASTRRPFEAPHQQQNPLPLPQHPYQSPQAPQQQQQQPISVPQSTPLPTISVQPKKILQRDDPVDEITKGIQDMKIRNTTGEATMEKILELLILQQANQNPQRPYPPNSFNRNYPDESTRIRECFWDGGTHSRDRCYDLQAAIARGDVHRRGNVVYTGREGMDGGELVPVPKKVNRKVEKWQKDMLADMMKKKESEVEHVEANPGARCVTARGREEREDDDDDSFDEIINGKPVMLRRISQVCDERRSASIDEKRGRTYDDIGREENKRTRKGAKPAAEPELPSIQTPQASPLPPKAPIAAIDHPSTERPDRAEEKKEKKKHKIDVLMNLADKIRNVPVTGITIGEVIDVIPQLSTKLKEGMLGQGNISYISSVLTEELAERVGGEVRRAKALEKLYAVGSPTATGKVEGIKVNMLLDNGAELCLLSRKFFEQLGIPVDTTIDCSVGSASSGDSEAYGVCHEVEVNIGGLITSAAFFVVEGLTQDVILGRPWERKVRAKHENKDDGSCWTTIRDEEGNQVEFCSVEPDNMRNRGLAAFSGKA